MKVEQQEKSNPKILKKKHYVIVYILLCNYFVLFLGKIIIVNFSCFLGKNFINLLMLSK